MKYIQNNEIEKIKDKIKIVKIKLFKLSNIITGKDRDNIKKELKDIAKKAKLTKTHKDNIYNRLLEIERGINFIKKYKKINHGDKNYYGLKDIENLYKDLGDYYRPILAKQAFNNNYEFYTIRGDKNKELSLKEYIDMITPYLYEIINKKKSTNQKTQLDIGINFSHLTDKEKNHTSYIKSENIEILPVMIQMKLLKNLLVHFLTIIKNNYKY